VQSPYLDFSRQQWSRLRSATPLTLDDRDLEQLRGVGEYMALSEVTDVYLPLSRLLNLSVAASRDLFAVTNRFLGHDAARVPFIIGIAGSVGTIVGLISGFIGGILDSTIMRIVDVLMAFPGIILAILIMATLGASLVNVVIAVGIGAIPWYARTVRGATLVIKENDYILSARALGATPMHIMYRHILPNVLGPVVVLVTVGIGGAILAISGLSYLGLGAKPPSPEWGAMLSQARIYLRKAWWITAFPGLAIMVSVFAINLIGDALRDALDPQLRGALKE